MATPVSDRIAKLKAQEEQIAAKVAKLEAVEKAKAKRLEQRRRMIVGEAVLAAVAKDSEFGRRLRPVLSANVERKADRDAVADLLKGDGG